jgi:hypothetical protein
VASRRHLRRKRCDGKVPYTDPAAAERERLRLEAQEGVAIETYSCPNCGKLHNGHALGSQTLSNQAKVAFGYYD